MQGRQDAERSMAGKKKNKKEKKKINRKKGQGVARVTNRTLPAHPLTHGLVATHTCVRHSSTSLGGLQKRFGPIPRSGGKPHPGRHLPSAAPNNQVSLPVHQSLRRSLMGRPPRSLKRPNQSSLDCRRPNEPSRPVLPAQVVFFFLLLFVSMAAGDPATAQLLR